MADAAEGAKFTVGTNAFAITYVGGDGNDVVVRATGAPRAATFTDIISLAGVLKLRLEATAGFNYTLEATTNVRFHLSSFFPLGTSIENIASSETAGHHHATSK